MYTCTICTDYKFKTLLGCTTVFFGLYFKIGKSDGLLIAIDHLGEFKSHLLQLFECLFSPVHLPKSYSKFSNTLKSAD